MVYKIPVHIYWRFETALKLRIVSELECFVWPDGPEVVAIRGAEFPG